MEKTRGRDLRRSVYQLQEAEAEIASPHTGHLEEME
jgi:hypothetical protein